MRNKGFTILELLIAFAIIAILVSILTISFGKFNKSQALIKDKETIVEVLGQARSLTLASQGASQYGVHFGSSTVVLFSGSSYSPTSPSNQTFTLWTSDLIVGLNLAGSSSDIVFERLTGETAQYGKVTIVSPTLKSTSTVTIYKTGTVQFP